MKYTVLATEHREGSFTAKSGKDAGQVKNYNFFRLHCVKKNRENVGGVEVLQVRATPDIYSQLVAECGGKETDILNRKLDFEVQKVYENYILKDFEVVE